jgi:hypothetical protein
VSRRRLPALLRLTPYEARIVPCSRLVTTTSWRPTILGSVPARQTIGIVLLAVTLTLPLRHGHPSYLQEMAFSQHAEGGVNFGRKIITPQGFRLPLAGLFLPCSPGNDAGTLAANKDARQMEPLRGLKHEGCPYGYDSGPSARRASSPLRELAMTSTPGSRDVELQVNLAVVEGHYRDALRPHFPDRSRAAQYAAIRDIPSLLDEIERLWTLLTETRIRHANLRAAALATISSHDADEMDPLSHLRAGLSGDPRRGWGPGNSS